jgi:hypothetical protein
MCAPKDLGGLGLKDLGRFNLALLGKWRWRLFSEKGSVWTEVLKAKYFGSGKWGCNQLASVWWRDVWKSCFDVGVDSYDVWFEKGVVRKVGEGNEVLFWKELWVGTELLKNSFHKLFHLSVQKNCLINEMGVWREDSWVWEFRWRRRLSSREEVLLRELRLVLDTVMLTCGCPDQYRWRADPSGVYSVRSAYDMILDCVVEDDAVFRLLWAVNVPSNYTVFGWRLLADRLQTKVNLQRRHILPDGSDLSCPMCGLAEETVDHLFFSCKFALQLWYRLYFWLGVFTCCPGDRRNHFQQHVAFSLSSKQNVWWRSVWLAVVWGIWVSRNDLVFRQRVPEVDVVFDLSVLRSWRWLSVRASGFSSSLYEWTTNPVYCLKGL